MVSVKEVVKKSVCLWEVFRCGRWFVDIGRFSTCYACRIQECIISRTDYRNHHAHLFVFKTTHSTHKSTMSTENGIMNETDIPSSKICRQVDEHLSIHLWKYRELQVLHWKWTISPSSTALLLAGCVTTATRQNATVWAASSIFHVAWITMDASGWRSRLHMMTIIAVVKIRHPLNYDQVDLPPCRLSGNDEFLCSAKCLMASSSTSPGLEH